MSIVKSFSVGNGDMFYIKHNSDNFTTIDCCLSEENKEKIMDELKKESRNKGITRFISTHPDQDHIGGLKYYNEQLPINNFYCVKNEATKENETEDFIEYCNLRDGDKHFYIYKGCRRKWINESDEERGSSGITILWPDTNNQDYKDALEQAKNGGSPNNISPIIKYSLENGAKMLWMGDLETEFMEKIEKEVEIPNIDILFAPHHGRDSGKVPKSWLDKMSPKIVIIGEAPSKHINYYQDYNTITQNSAGDIIFECETGKVHIYVSNESYSVDFLDNERKQNRDDGYYIGTLQIS
jgi:beta-lactamase superfamily II metal-dependent hydrolase